MTCLAVWAAMRPKSMGGRGSTRKSPIWASALRRWGAGQVDLGRLVLDLFGDFQIARQGDGAGRPVDIRADVVLVAVLGPPSLLDGLFHCLENLVTLDPLVARHGFGHLKKLRTGVNRFGV